MSGDEITIKNKFYNNIISTHFYHKDSNKCRSLILIIHKLLIFNKNKVFIIFYKKSYLFIYELVYNLFKKYIQINQLLKKIDI